MSSCSNHSEPRKEAEPESVPVKSVSLLMPLSCIVLSDLCGLLSNGCRTKQHDDHQVAVTMISFFHVKRIEAGGVGQQPIQ